MFYINKKVKESKIDGLGLFADQDIEKGERIYKHSPDLDLQLTPEQFEALDKQEQQTIMHYGYIDKNTGSYRLDHDDVRFVNDSNNPNIGANQEGVIVALKDIAKNVELVQNYSDFENRRFV